jgi:hypothetical protein
VNLIRTVEEVVMTAGGTEVVVVGVTDTTGTIGGAGRLRVRITVLVVAGKVGLGRGKVGTGGRTTVRPTVLGSSTAVGRGLTAR